ncbi:MAG: hypothetical protein U9N04_00690 [Patescibacteria group bacterium]|nr:hypothetical protein [Patescibacteria group bacterium]
MNLIKTKNTNFNKKKTQTVFGRRLFFFAISLLVIFAVQIQMTKADSIGENRTFLVDSSYEYDDRSETMATLRKISSNTYFYIEDDYFNELSSDSKVDFYAQLNSLALDFDSTVYPKTREAFGSEWSPGIDNDRKITILFTEMKENIGGYFNPNDEYKKEKVSGEKSNEREMFYLNVAFINDKRIKSFLAHEFQHMITWYQKTKLKGLFEDVWLNESRSEYASTATGYDDSYVSSNLDARVKNFLLDSNYEDSLTGWKNKIDDYSSVNLFAQYLADYYGKTIFKTMIENDAVGIGSINKALESLGNPEVNFRSVFTNWTVANYLNNTSLFDNKYGYKNPNLSYSNLHLDLTKSYLISNNNPARLIEKMDDWSARYYKFEVVKNGQKNNIIEIDFNGDNSGKFGVPYVIYYDNGAKEIFELALDDNQDSKIHLDNFEKNISSILIIPNSQKKESGFGYNIENYSFSISVKLSGVKTYTDGSLLRASDDEKVYLIEDSKKRWITTSATFALGGYKWNDIVLVIPKELELYKDGEDIIVSELRKDGSLVKGAENKIYLIEDGKKRWITTAEVFISRGYNWNDVSTVFDEELNLHLDGENIYMNIKNGNLVKSNSEKVYLIEDGKKRWITTAEVFVSNGYNWGDIIIVSEEELGAYEEGKEIG